MNGFYIALWIVLGALGLLLVASFVCFIMVFYSKKRKPLGEDEYDIPPGRAYEAHREQIIAWTKEMRTLPHEKIKIKSYDGLTLCAKYYEYKKGAPTEILFHGYRGNSERDLCGGVNRCFSIGRNALIVDQRAAGESDGHIITFGIREHRDALSWVKYANERFGIQTTLILTGISMGAATVLMASAEPLPENVKCILADCSYSSTKEIIKEVLRKMKLPTGIFYPLIRLGALIFGGFDIEKNSPIKAMEKSKIPTIFIHGDKDKFVPCYMSEQLYEACRSDKKKFVKVAGAAHGLAFPVAREEYLEALREFSLECGMQENLSILNLNLGGN